VLWYARRLVAFLRAKAAQVASQSQQEGRTLSGLLALES
jgi:hypothetical protein